MCSCWRLVSSSASRWKSFLAFSLASFSVCANRTGTSHTHVNQTDKRVSERWEKNRTPDVHTSAKWLLRAVCSDMSGWRPLCFVKVSYSILANSHVVELLAPAGAVQKSWGGGVGGFCVNVIYYEASLCLRSLRSQVHFRVCLISANPEMCQAARAEQATAVKMDVCKR